MCMYSYEIVLLDSLQQKKGFGGFQSYGPYLKE